MWWLRERVRIVENFLADHPYAVLLRLAWVVLGLPLYAVLLFDEVVRTRNAP